MSNNAVTMFATDPSKACKMQQAHQLVVKHSKAQSLHRDEVDDTKGEDDPGMDLHGACLVGWLVVC